MPLLPPSLEHLAAYREALERGWSPDNLRPRETAEAERRQIAEDPAGFVGRQVDREALGPPITLPDGSRFRRLPGYRLWIWDGEFCGTIGLRWQPGTPELPPYVLGHIGYSVVPWKRRQGHASRALAELLPMARAEGLPYVLLTTEPGNVASRRVIEANGGRLLDRFVRPASLGGGESLRFRIDLESKDA